MSSARSRSDVAPLSVPQAAAAIAAAAFAVRPAPRVVVDGRSGAGKTTLVAALMRLHPGFQMVALDDLYPGWDGLHAGAARARDDVLAAHARGVAGSWRRWDWDAARYAEAHAVDPDRPLVVEGAGALTARSAALSDVRVWVHADADQRRVRALARDGATYEPHWERWARQEAAHIAAHDPPRWADMVIELT